MASDVSAFEPIAAEPLAPLILSAQLDAESFAWLDGLRRVHFPPERNVLSAHLTLFHKLPGEEIGAIRNVIEETIADYAAIPLEFTSLRYLGQGVAINVESPPLTALRQHLVGRWEHHLTRQDAQGFRPHVTIQNKVAQPVAKALHASLLEEWTPRAGTCPGLALWHYRGGPWEPIAEFPFPVARDRSADR